MNRFEIGIHGEKVIVEAHKWASRYDEQGCKILEFYSDDDKLVAEFTGYSYARVISCHR